MRKQEGEAGIERGAGRRDGERAWREGACLAYGGFPPPATQYERQLKQGAVLTKRHDDIAFSPQLIKMKAILNLF